MYKKYLQKISIYDEKKLKIILSFIHNMCVLWYNTNEIRAILIKITYEKYLKCSALLFDFDWTDIHVHKL